MSTISALALRGDETELYRMHHERLIQTVARRVRAPHALIEDACQMGWTILLRRQPDRGPTLFAWLRTVAVREAYRLSREERREAALDSLTADGDSEPQLAAPTSLDDAIEARRALQTLAALPTSQRNDLALLIAGYHYDEIARHGAQPRSTNNVNKHITKARARILRQEAASR